jgi:hypothetical protein
MVRPSAVPLFENDTFWIVDDPLRSVETTDVTRIGLPMEREDGM